LLKVAINTIHPNQTIMKRNIKYRWSTILILIKTSNHLSSVHIEPKQSKKTTTWPWLGTGTNTSACAFNYDLHHQLYSSCLGCHSFWWYICSMWYFWIEAYYIVTLPRYFSFRLPHLNISTGPPSDELDKNSQRAWLSENLSHWNGYNQCAKLKNMHTDWQISSCWEHISSWNMHE
jgi:hypothetical protein